MLKIDFMAEDQYKAASYSLNTTFFHEPFLFQGNSFIDVYVPTLMMLL